MIIIFFLILIFFILFLCYNNHYKKTKYINDSCKVTRWGCCPDGITVSKDYRGSNCFSPRPTYYSELDMVTKE